MATIPVGLELYSVRNELADDPRGTLKAVADMGYEGVEFAGPPRYSADEINDMLEETGLTCCGWHTPFNLVQEDTLEETIKLNRAIGNKYIIIPGLPGDLMRTVDDWAKIAGFFNNLAEKLAPHGMKTGYHNHHIEFEEDEFGRTPWDAFFSNTSQDVIMQMDLGNAMRGGADVMSVLQEYPGRCQTIHLKPYSNAAGADEPAAGYKPLIGEDDVPWHDVFEFCQKKGNTEWFIVEYESDAYPPLEAVDRCLRALRQMGYRPRQEKT